MKKESTESYEATMEVVRKQRDALLGEKKALELKIQAAMSRQNGAHHNPISLNDYVDYLKREIDRKAEEFSNKWSIRDTPPNYGLAKHHSKVEWKNIDSGYLNVLSGALGAEVSGSELCFYFPDLIHKRLVDALKARYGDSWGNDDLAPASARKQIADEAELELDQLRPQLRDVEGKIRALNRAIGD
ncbi:hypothetical protein A6723_019900 [Pseudomonas sp. AU11447]|uniref:hypothetical protein n=1 Tax=Pseudomonas sp. AU11447 TaxID=1843184 RepID=UPI0007EC5CFB|nr:hypothetical protein [Pseudomonas sp. AU11447]OBY90572.1 hypothetical protein A6723_019900 [Pseudomonas sp. AU11447]